MRKRTTMEISPGSAIIFWCLLFLCLKAFLI